MLEDRALTDAEVELVRWLLEHGTSDALSFLPQLERARVVSRCSCGCASIDFAIAGQSRSAAGLNVLADYEWRTSTGALCGAFVFAQEALLGGLEVWSIDGQCTPHELPSPELLQPLGYSSTR